MDLAGFVNRNLDSLSEWAARRIERARKQIGLIPPEGAKYAPGDVIHTARAGCRLGDLRVLEVREGGYALVYIVVQKKTGRWYAIKSFQDWCLERPRVLDQFMREAETWIRIGKHPNLVHARTLFHLHGRPHLLLECVTGEDLWRQVKSGPMPLRAVLRYAIQLCRGMAHAQVTLPGFVHRDIKPSNCMIAGEGRVKLTDFGQAKVWRDAKEETISSYSSGNGSKQRPSELHTPANDWGQGTPQYMAPEQFDTTNRTDVRTDVYSFGVMLFEMVAGKRPFKGCEFEECDLAHRTSIPPNPATLNPKVPQSLAALILKCLEKLPDDRPADFNILETKLSLILWDMYRERLPGVRTQELTFEETCDRAAGLDILGYADEALACYDEVLSVRPRLVQAWEGKAATLAGLARYSDALMCYERTLELTPGSPFAWGGKGKMLTELGRHTDALECFDRALSFDPNLAYIWNYKGETLIALTKCDEAMKCFDRARSLDPKLMEIYNNQGIALGKLGRAVESIESYQQAISLNPNYAEAHFNLGIAYSNLGQPEKAVEAYRKAIDVKPDYAAASTNLDMMLKSESESQAVQS